MFSETLGAALWAYCASAHIADVAAAGETMVLSTLFKYTLSGKPFKIPESIISQL